MTLLYDRDLTSRQTITMHGLPHAPMTPYYGVTVTGWPVGTVVRGAARHVGRRTRTPGRGEAVRFWKTMLSRQDIALVGIA